MDAENIDEVEDVISWLEAAARSIEVEAPGIHRFPAVPEGGVQVSLDDAAALGVLVDLVRATKPAVYYTQIFNYTERDLASELRGFGLEESDALNGLLGQPVQASVVVVAGGVTHRLDVLAARWRATTQVAEVAAMVEGTYGAHWETRDELGPYRACLDGLADQLREDEQFFASCTNDVARRRYATTLLRAQVRDAPEDLPWAVRGRVLTAVTDALTWWRQTGRPARMQALRAKLPDLVDDVAGDTLAQRKATARTVLEHIDPLAVTSDLVETLARMAPRHPPVQP